MTNQEFPYEVIEEYVRGGCSVIYKIRHRSGGEADSRFVLKSMDVGDNDPQNYKRFYMEYEFLRAYPHPNLVEVTDYFPDYHGCPAYVMEWVEGHTWQEFWRDRLPMKDLQLFLEVFKQFCDVLDFIHKHQIIHRDLKPQNVLVSHRNVLKLIDFGIMKVADLTLYTHRNTFMGSAYYVAPEGISGEQVNHTADIFSLGVMLYDLFTGMKPFQGHTLGETIYQRLAKRPQAPSHIADLPVELDRVILKMLERDPYQRQQSCREVYSELEQVFARLRRSSPTLEVPEIDILTKGPLFHGHFLEACQSSIKTRNVLFLQGEAGSGKTTIVENLCTRLQIDAIKLDCRPDSSPLSFMELILRNLNLTSPTAEMTQWREILGSALPGLQWPSPNSDQALPHGAIMSAFKYVLLAIDKPAIITIEDLQDASPALVAFLQELGQLAARKANAKLYLIVTTRAPVPNLAALGKPFRVSFPDVISLSDFLTSQFGGCQIPIDLTESLVEKSNENIARFIKLIQKLKDAGRLVVEKGVLVQVEIDGGTTQEELSAVPSGLADFSSDQVRQLEWIALCPDGIDLNILKNVAQADISSLGRTIDQADRQGLLEYRSTATEGFRWKDESAKQYLIASLSSEQKTRRFRELAKTIETESRQYLPYSPPLWLILCRLYQQAGNDAHTADYAFKYARYCSQTANYEPIRSILGQFIAHPAFRGNQEFWCMLALAHQGVEVAQALFFASKALKIQENIQVVALLAILEFQGGDMAASREYARKVFHHPLEELDIHYVSQLMPILMALGEVENAGKLYSMMSRILKGRNDLFATNTLIIARLHLLQPKPAEVIDAANALKEELLSQTNRQLNLIVSLAHQELFEYESALDYLTTLDMDGKSAPWYYRELLFCYLNFDRIGEIKHLIQDFNDRVKENDALAQLSPLFQLVTAMLVQDPKAYDLDHVLDAISRAGVEKSSWLVLLTSKLEFRLLKTPFLKGVCDFLNTVAVPWARHQIPRMKILGRLKINQLEGIGGYLRIATEQAEQYNLIMEKLYLYALRDLLLRNHVIEEDIPIDFPPGLLESGQAGTFLAARFPRQT